MRTILLIFPLSVAVAFTVSCHGKSSEQPVNQTRKASATEVFHLRGECAALGEKILKRKQDDLEPWLNSATYAWWHNVSQVSHYSPETNRCYVELTTETSSRHDSNYDAWSRELYDGQTKEMLGMTRQEVASGNSPKKDTGMVFVSAPTQYDDTFKGASKYIDDAMEDDRTKR